MTPAYPPEYDRPDECEVCGKLIDVDKDGCRCPECPKCGEIGNPACYDPNRTDGAHPLSYGGKMRRLGERMAEAVIEAS